MNKKIIGIFLCMLFIGTFILPVTGTMNKETAEMEKQMVEINDDETIWSPVFAFLSGRITNKHEGGTGWICNAVSLRIITFSPIKFRQYTNFEDIEVVKPGLGIFTNRFIIGFYKVWL